MLGIPSRERHDPTTRSEQNLGGGLFPCFSCLIFFFVNGFLIELYTQTLSGERLLLVQIWYRYALKWLFRIASISSQNHYAITIVLLSNQRNEKKTDEGSFQSYRIELSNKIVCCILHNILIYFEQNLRTINAMAMLANDIDNLTWVLRLLQTQLAGL